MLANKWLQIALGSVGWLVWLAVYISARFAKRDMRGWKTPLIFTGFVGVAVWLGAWVTDHVLFGNLLEMNALGMILASNWLTRYYPGATAPTVTTLNLSTRDNRDSRVPSE